MKLVMTYNEDILLKLRRQLHLKRAQGRSVSARTLTGWNPVLSEPRTFAGYTVDDMLEDMECRLRSGDFLEKIIIYQYDK
jgi:hypothetical protein